MTTEQTASRFYRVKGDRMCVHHHKTAAAALRCPIGNDFGLLPRPDELDLGDSEFNDLFGRDGVYPWPGGPFMPSGAD